MQVKRLPALWASPAQAIFYVTLLLCAIGTVNIFSASFVTAGREWQDSYFFLKRQGFAMAIGIMGMVVLARLDYRRYHKPLAILLSAGTLIALALVPVIGVEVNGARRWLNLGFSFQPSEFAKLSALMVSAVYLGWRVDKGRPVSFLSWPIVVTIMMAALIHHQPDMGTAIVVGMLCIVVYILAGAPPKQWLGLGLVGSVLAVAMVFSAPYRKVRIEAWLDPWAYQQDKGYQAVQALMAIGSGQLSGTGLGMGASKFFYLPEAHTDFAFAVLSQEWGFIGAIIVLGLFSLLGWYGLQIALRAPDGSGMLLAGGVTALVVGQAVGNMAMVCGLLPVTGVPLPYISFGGTSLMVNLIATGILISVGRKANLAISRPNDPEPQPELERRGRRRLRLVDHPGV